MEDDYRSKHKAEYAKRVEEEQQKVEKHRIKSEITEHLMSFINDIRQYETLNEIHKTVDSMLIFLTENSIIWDEKEILNGICLRLIETINTNPHTLTNFNNPLQVITSNQLHQNVKHILELCGSEADIEVNYIMDCSRDAEIAYQMDQEHDQLPPMVRRPRGRPRKVPQVVL